MTLSLLGLACRLPSYVIGAMCSSAHAGQGHYDSGWFFEVYRLILLSINRSDSGWKSHLHYESDSRALNKGDFRRVSSVVKAILGKLPPS
ncbi:hypothetical protein L3X38_036565 [Prunus dulcis]|uniref:Secreted protein n=1 Tax=Prunus dulcis TaxID=3755 RepID=A0AAD4V2S7_PRUDU|nr:hypothetical protein L3X38_036565 [Prunus dulcis]